jgi:hypothetical protein
LAWRNSAELFSFRPALVAIVLTFILMLTLVLFVAFNFFALRVELEG